MTRNIAQGLITNQAVSSMQWSMPIILVQIEKIVIIVFIAQIGSKLAKEQLN